MTDTTIYNALFGVVAGPDTTIIPLGGTLFEIFMGEVDRTSVNFTATVRKTSKVSDPSMLALLGLGLLGIGFSQR